VRAAGSIKKIKTRKNRETGLSSLAARRERREEKESKTSARQEGKQQTNNNNGTTTDKDFVHFKRNFFFVLRWGRPRRMRTDGSGSVRELFLLSSQSRAR
jgi:5-methylcytosine-specific restriction endonuclease McrBC GTP-binding regulatory subunit McrB